MRILNIGCGNETYGTHRIDLYKTRTTTHVVNIDKKGLPFPDNYFDVIRANQILEHLKNLDLFSREIYRVLKKGGTVQLRTDHAGFIFYYLLKRKEHNELLRRWYKLEGFGHRMGEDAHYHLFVASHLRSLFKRFSSVEIEYFYPGSFIGARTLMKLLPFKLGASQIDAWLVK